MKKMRRRKWLFGAGLLALLMTGSIFAYFSASDSLENQFYTAEAKIFLNETFNPKDEWLPGEEKQKEVRFGNEGSIAAVLRIKFTRSLTMQNGTEEKDTDKIQLKFADGFQTEWEQHGEWYYYKKVLEPSAMTDITLRSVTISDTLGNDEHQITKDYSASVFDVQVEGELLQASLASKSAVWEDWDWIPEVSGSQVTWKRGN